MPSFLLLGGVIAISLAMAAALVLVVPPGLPGDEPAHVSNVAWYAHSWRFPVLGAPGVLYEAQMGPVYYWVAGPLYRVVEGMGIPAAVRVLRAVGLPLLAVNTILIYRLARRLTPEPAFALLAAAFVGLSPSLLSIYGSVQNDSTVMVLTETVMILCAGFIVEERLDARRAAVAGLVAGLAVLSKANAIFLLGAVPFAWLMLFRARAVRFCIVFVIVAAGIGGWWFVRNQIVYGDYTAQSALTKFHYNNNPPPIDLWQPRVLGPWLYGLAASYWFPTEYFRDVFRSGLPVRLTSIAITLVSASGWVAWARTAWSSRPAFISRGARVAAFLAIQYLASIALYAYSCLRVTYFAPRTTFPTFGLFALALAFGLFVAAGRGRQRGRLLLLGALPLALLAYDVYLIVLVRAEPRLPFQLA